MRKKNIHRAALVTTNNASPDLLICSGVGRRSIDCTEGIEKKKGRNHGVQYHVRKAKLRAVHVT